MSARSRHTHFGIPAATAAGESVHGNGRRVPRPAVLDLALLAEFNAGTARAVAANADLRVSRWRDAMVRREAAS